MLCCEEASKRGSWEPLTAYQPCPANVGAIQSHMHSPSLWRANECIKVNFYVDPHAVVHQHTAGGLKIDGRRSPTGKEDITAQNPSDLSAFRTVDPHQTGASHACCVHLSTKRWGDGGGAPIWGRLLRGDNSHGSHRMSEPSEYDTRTDSAS